MTPSALRDARKARSQSPSGTTSVTSGSSSTCRASISPSARRHDAGVLALPERDVELPEADLVERHRHRRAASRSGRSARRAGPRAEPRRDARRAARALDDDVERTPRRNNTFSARRSRTRACARVEAHAVALGAEHVHPAAAGARGLRGEQADRARADHEHLVAGATTGGSKSELADAGERLGRAPRRDRAASPGRVEVRAPGRRSRGANAPSTCVADRAPLETEVRPPGAAKPQAPHVEKYVSRDDARARLDAVAETARRRRPRGPSSPAARSGTRPPRCGGRCRRSRRRAPRAAPRRRPARAPGAPRARRARPGRELRQAEHGRAPSPPRASACRRRSRGARRRSPRPPFPAQRLARAAARQQPVAERAAEGVAGAEPVDDLDLDRAARDRSSAVAATRPAAAELHDRELRPELEQPPRRLLRLGARRRRPRPRRDCRPRPSHGRALRGPSSPASASESQSVGRWSRSCTVGRPRPRRERRERRAPAGLGREPRAGRPEERHPRAPRRGRARPSSASGRARSARDRRGSGSRRAGGSRRRRAACAGSGACRRTPCRRRTAPARRGRSGRTPSSPTFVITPVR